MSVRKRIQKDLRMSNFALLWVVFKWHHGSKGVNRQRKKEVTRRVYICQEMTEVRSGPRGLTGWGEVATRDARKALEPATGQAKRTCFLSGGAHSPRPQTPSDDLTQSTEFSLCTDASFRNPFHPCVTAAARKRSRSFCQTCRWQVTAKHTCTMRIHI